MAEAAQLEFRILGPLEAVREGAAIPLPRPKQRALLTDLLLHANEIVSTDRLIDDLWGAEPPKTALAALQGLIADLRKLLGAELIETRAPGYVLRLEKGRLDLHRFERLLDEGVRARGAGNPERGAALLREALGLWRGRPLADVALEEFALTSVARLDELRLSCIEARIDADLALGRQAAVIGELEALVAEHPLREGPRGQLMLALYRSGRQGDALEAYQDARRVLVDELGIDPSPQLQRLERGRLVPPVPLPHADLIQGLPEAPPLRSRGRDEVLLPFLGVANEALVDEAVAVSPHAVGHALRAADVDFEDARELLLDPLSRRSRTRHRHVLAWSARSGRAAPHDEQDSAVTLQAPWSIDGKCLQPHAAQSSQGEGMIRVRLTGARGGRSGSSGSTHAGTGSALCVATLESSGCVDMVMPPRSLGDGCRPTTPRFPLPQENLPHRRHERVRKARTRTGLALVV